MHKITATLFAFTLAGCAGVPQVATQPAPVPTKATKTQAIIAAACGFTPTLSVISQIYAAKYPGLTTTSTVATAVCDALRNTGLGLLDRGAPAVGDVVVHGTFKDGRKI